MSEIQQADPRGLSAHTMKEIRELVPRYPHPRSAVMPALDVAQEEIGFLTPRAMAQVAEALDLDAGYVEGVATFYSLFHLEPVGKHRLYVCTNLSCMLRGAYDILEHANRVTGVEETGAVSADGLFSTEEVECLGACEYAPMMRLDGEYHYDLTPEIIDRLVADRKASKVSSPARGAGNVSSPARGAGNVSSPARGEVPAKPAEGVSASTKQRTARKGTPKDA